MTRRIISIAVIAAIAVALAGCSTFGIDPEQVLSDAAMTTAIKSRLAGDNKFVDALRVVGSPSAAPRNPAGQKQ